MLPIAFPQGGQKGYDTRVVSTNTESLGLGKVVICSPVDKNFFLKSLATNVAIKTDSFIPLSL